MYDGCFDDCAFVVYYNRVLQVTNIGCVGAINRESNKLVKLKRHSWDSSSPQTRSEIQSILSLLCRHLKQSTTELPLESSVLLKKGGNVVSKALLCESVCL